MAHEHPSGIDKAHDRAIAHPEWQSLVFSGDRFIQSAELNEAQRIARGRHDRLGSLVASDGDRVSGAAAVVIPDPDPELAVAQLILTAGEIYIGGDRLPVAAAVIEGVPTDERVVIGVRKVTTWQTSEDNPDLLGLVPGSTAEGEPGAAREIITISWALSDDEGEGDFVPVYVMQDGTIIDQTPPPSLSGVNAAIGIYDYGANGNYIVRGCRVTALGKVDDDQVFSIEEGEANILGEKRTRYTALRYAVEEAFDAEEVAGEARTWPGGASATFATYRFPIAQVNSCLVTKEFTATITRGGTAGGADPLPNSSVTSIIEVKQGGTTYVETTDWVRVGDTISWSPGGAEPNPGSSYTVKYRYLALVTPDAVTDTSITLSGGVTGGTVILGYDFKLPRIDAICLNSNGEPVYIKGVSARENPLPPLVPAALLKLCEVTNNWMTKPAVENSGIRSVPYEELWRFLGRLIDHERLIQLERIKSNIDAREPVAKKGTFVDPFTNDFYRDEGEAQTGSVGNGFLSLAITPTFYAGTLTAPVMLDYVEEVIARQEFVTGCMKVNPYQNFVPMPASMRLTPAADFWAESQTAWASPVTVEFNRGVRWDNGPLVVQSTTTQQLDQRQEQADFLRQISVAFTIKGMGPSENLQSLTFDGIDVKPPGTQTANGSGELTSAFTIPSNVPAGSKVVHAVGAGGSEAFAQFSGGGVITITTLRRVTNVERWTQGVSVTVGAGAARVDPLAQTFTPAELRHIVGVDIRLCAIGDTNNDLLIHQVGVELGIPNEDVVAEAYVPMDGAVVGWKSARYHFPVLTPADRASAFVVKTDDANHSLSIASLGGFDAAKQSYVGAQPYTTGVLLSSSNAQTWTPHQNDDLTFRLVAAKFTSLTKTVSLGSFAVVNKSDFQVRADVELPSSECSVVFEIERPGGQIYRLLPYQVLSLPEYITETVQLRAILTGTEKLSPILYPPILFIAGEIATSGTYITRAFKLGTAVKLTSYFKAAIPQGATVDIKYDKADDDWQNLPLIATEVLSDPVWVEQKHEASGITATQGRLKITITGGPAARPRIGDLGAAVM